LKRTRVALCCAEIDLHRANIGMARHITKTISTLSAE
jgi:hypothetical protein